MPVLQNPKHERFAQALAKGLSADEAYEKAGYRPNRGNASTLKAKQNVSARVAEILDRAAQKVSITRQKILEELAGIGFADIETMPVKASDKRAALMDIAKLEGWVIERSETGRPGDFDRMTDDELDRFIEERAGGTGRRDQGAKTAH